MTNAEFEAFMDQELDRMTAEGKTLDEKADRIVYLLEKYDITVTVNLPRKAPD